VARSSRRPVRQSKRVSRPNQRHLKIHGIFFFLLPFLGLLTHTNEFKKFVGVHPRLTSADSDRDGARRSPSLPLPAVRRLVVSACTPRPLLGLALRGGAVRL